MPDGLWIEPIVRVAQTIRRFLLADDREIVSRQMVGATYKQAMERLGISDAKCLREQLIARYGKDVLALLNIGVDSDWLRRVAQCQSPPIGLARNSLLIDFLFGSYNGFLKSIKTIEVDLSDIKIDECKKIILREAKARPGNGSRYVSERFPNEYAFIKRFDSAWIRGVFYSKKSTRPYSKRRGEIDDALVRHMKDRLVKICEEDCRPIKITRQRLMHGFKSRNHISRDIQLYPQSAAFIDSVVETSEHYVCRLARYLWLAGETATQIHQATGLPLADAASLARRPIPKKGKEPTYVLQTIQARRLSRVKAR
ncbi:hypothetical protein [Paraburkholderia sp. Cpub6]|uniref:hypothetical protein n=1 Tax=Paraburkholderia sp. Cpub6 TaxID=2723094 RepID=UPI0017E3D18B|nr:hypothetical protein [Paraburkholderia sp. Cpub6]MBB5460250.1 hypothetical protein [Paraburkholderia sp. Cpub6]